MKRVLGWQRSCLLVVLTVLPLLVPGGTALAEDPATLPSSGSPRPPVGSYDSSFMIPEMTPGHHECEEIIGLFEQGWSRVYEDPPHGYLVEVLEGEVVAGHVPHGDLYFNHDTEDANFFVAPDDNNPMATFTTINYRRLLSHGNFVTGEPKEHGRIEVEWEYGALTGNDAADSGYYGFPNWAWPNIGDRVYVEGYWILDCGHSEYRAEIHPPWMVVTFRNMMQSEIARQANRKGWVAPLGPDDRDFSRVTRADIFISSFGGEAVDNIFDDDHFLGRVDWWMPVNSKDYAFDVLAPEDTPEGAQLIWKWQDPPSDFIAPPGATGPSVDDVTISPFTRADGRAAVRVEIPFSTIPDADYLLFAKTLLVGYDVSEPDTKHFRIHVSRWNVFYDSEELATDEAEYSPWVHSGDVSLFVPISDGGEDEDECADYQCDSDGQYTPYCEPDEDENNCANTTFDRFNAPEDALVISFRAKETDVPAPPEENDELGWADQSFTAAENWGIGTHFLRQQDFLWGGEHHDSFNCPLCPASGEDDCDGPDGTCFEVTYSIERIFDPTSMAIGVPPVQYAMDPSHYTATVVTPGPPDKPRRHLPINFSLSGDGGGQIWHGTTGDDGVAAPRDLIILAAGEYTQTSGFSGNGVLDDSVASAAVTLSKDFTESSLEVEDEVRWGHHDPFTLTLIEPNVGQDEPPLPVVGKMMTVNMTGPNGAGSFPAGPTDDAGTVTIEPLMTLPPGNYQATACFEEDPWFLGSCSVPQPVKVTPGFAAFARIGPVDIEGTTHTSLGDLHSEGSVTLGGSTHVLSAGSGERLEYVTTFLDGSTGSQYNLFQVTAFGLAPQYLASTYCNGGSNVMGVPVTYITSKTWNVKNDTVLSGIYCVTGSVKIQSRVTGTATIVATGTIQTTGGDQSLATADPTGADLLMLSGSMDAKAIALNQAPGFFKGAVVAAGGIEIAGMDTTVDTAVIGNTVTVKGVENVLDGR
jgi:hypothetical protein